MAHHMRAFMSKAENTEKENIYGQMVVLMKESGRIIRSVAM